MAYFKNIIFFVFLYLNFVLISFAQSQTTEIIINVKNQLGEVIPEAEITLSKSDQKEKLTKTNKQGLAQFLKLTPGEYQLSIVAAGFSDYKSENIIINKGEIKKLDIVLEIGSVESKVNIAGDDEADTENYGTTKNITQKQIENLPDDPKELERVLRSMAGESVTGEQMPISVNGIQGGNIPPKQAIQQIRVNQNVFSAQYEGPFGGGIEIFTQARIDKFSGYLSFNFADSRLNAADPFLGKRVPYQARNLFFSFSGPISKNTSFFGYGSHNENDSSAVVNATVLNSSLQPVEFKQSFATPNRSDNINFFINSDPTKKHKLYLNVNFGTSSGKGQNVGGFSLPETAANNTNQNIAVQGSDTYLANENVVNQTRVGIFYTANRSFGGSNDVAINVLDAFSGGGASNNSSNKDLRFDVANETTWQMGKYGLGFGWRIRGQRTNQVSMSNFNGTYTFSGRTAPVLDVNNNPVTDGSGNIITEEISSLESYRRTLLFRQSGLTNSQIRNLGGGANQFTISGGNPAIDVSQYDYGFYVQNSYKISPTLAVSAGLRYEDQTNIKSHLNLAPRVGFIWSPKANEKKKPIYALPRISVGYGIFYRRFDLSNFLSVRQSNDPDRSQYLITDANILDLYPNVPTIDLLQQFALPKSQRFIDPGLQAPFQSLFNINASKKLLKGFSLSTTFSYTKSFRQALTENINAPLAGTFNSQDPNSGIRPFGNIGNIYETTSTGKGRSFRYSANLNFPNSEKFYATIYYSFNKSKNDIVGGSGSPTDPYDFSREFAPTTTDGVHRLGGYLYYNLPYHFDISSDYSFNSGSRFNITTGLDTNGDGFYNERPAYATNLNKPGLISTPYGILDPNPAPGAPLIPRNLGRGSNNFEYNASISKSFVFGEDKKNKKPPKQRLNFELSVDNLFNVINKGNPVGNMSSPNFLHTLTGYSDGGITIINGAQSPNFVGRSMSFSVGFGF